MTASSVHSCAIVDGGAVLCAGLGMAGQLGNGGLQREISPVRVVGIQGATHITAQGYATCAVVDGGVWCWGAASAADDAGFGLDSPIPVPRTGLETGVTDIGGGESHVCVIKDGQVLCWGTNSDGQLADPSRMPTYVPRLIIDGGATDLGVGPYTSCAVVRGEAWCWGRNVWREVDPSSSELMVFAPRKVTSAGSDVVDLAAGDQATCALKGAAGNRRVLCWGSGPLGDGADITPRTVPAMVSGVVGDVTRLVVGRRHYCALANRQVLCWGTGRGIPGHTFTAVFPELVTVP